jgi:hypothetical protein
MRHVHPTPEHKHEALRKLERFNVEQVFAMQKKRPGPHSPRMPQKGNRRKWLCNKGWMVSRGGIEPSTY